MKKLIGIIALAFSVSLFVNSAELAYASNSNQNPPTQNPTAPKQSGWQKFTSGVKGAANKVATGAKKAASTVKVGATKAAAGVKSAAQKTGAAIKKGAVAVGAAATAAAKKVQNTAKAGKMLAQTAAKKAAAMSKKGAKGGVYIGKEYAKYLSTFPKDYANIEQGKEKSTMRDGTKFMCFYACNRLLCNSGIPSVQGSPAISPAKVKDTCKFICPGSDLVNCLGAEPTPQDEAAAAGVDVNNPEGAAPETVAPENEFAIPEEHANEENVPAAPVEVTKPVVKKTITTHKTVVTKTPAGPPGGPAIEEENAPEEAPTGLAAQLQKQKTQLKSAPTGLAAQLQRQKTQLKKVNPPAENADTNAGDTTEAPPVEQQ